MELIEARTAERIGSRRFFPYIQLHEFEALLFTDVDVLDDALSAVSPSRLMKLREIRASFETPEEIDEGETTAPSKRLIVLFPGYDKLAYGPLIAGRIGLDTLRACCPHFREWVKRLEGLTGVEEG